MEQNAYERFFKENIQVRYFPTPNGSDIAVLNHQKNEGFPWDDKFIQQLIDKHNPDGKKLHRGSPYFISLFCNKGGLTHTGVTNNRMTCLLSEWYKRVDGELVILD